MMMLRRSGLWRTALRTSSPSTRFVRLSSSAAPPLIRIQNATFYRNYPTPDDAATGQNPPLFPKLNFTLPSQGSVEKKSKSSEQDEQQHWAVIGSQGRTSLLEILRGQYVCDPPNARSYPYLLTDEIAAKDPRLRFVGNAVQYIGFSGEGSGAIGGTRGAYLSARYESHREETDWTLQQYLKGQTELNPMEGQEDGKVKDKALLAQVISDLRLEELLDMPVANLSNGQTRRARIAKALLSKPELLLLDDPFTIDIDPVGLDPATVRSISGFLHRLGAKNSPRLIMALRPQDKVPEWITHVMILGNSNQVLLQGSRAEVSKALGVWKYLSGKTKPRSLPAADKKILDKAEADMEKGILDRQLLWDLDLIPQSKGKVGDISVRGGEPLIEMNGVRVQYGDKTVLGNWQQEVGRQLKKGLHWTVRRGQRWIILGPNGSGKTTLLSLITSDHPQAYAMPMKMFGRSRIPRLGEPGVSLFELQSRMGHSSPEIHAFFPRQMTVRAAVESAFAETFLSKPKLDYEKDLDISAILRFFKPELDPHAAITTKEDPPRVSSKTSKEIFPKLTRSGQQFIPADYDVEYADTCTFGELSTSQQRLVLFLRAIIHKPDIIILDEAFSSMPASMRDKCINFLEIGEHGRNRASTAMRRTSSQDTWLKGFTTDSSASAPTRHHGISDDQALIMISHVKEEIPDCVRFYMRLPSEDPGDGSEPLDFRFGTIRQGSTMSDPKIWEMAWAPPSVFMKHARRSWRKKSTDKDDDDHDDTVFEWYSL